VLKKKDGLTDDKGVRRKRYITSTFLAKEIVNLVRKKKTTLLRAREQEEGRRHEKEEKGGRAAPTQVTSERKERKFLTGREEGGS